MQEWTCINCGQVCVAATNPTDSFPLWSDDHKCVFKKNELTKTVIS